MEVFNRTLCLLSIASVFCVALGDLSCNVIEGFAVEMGQVYHPLDVCLISRDGAEMSSSMRHCNGSNEVNIQKYKGSQVCEGPYTIDNSVQLGDLLRISDCEGLCYALMFGNTITDVAGCFELAGEVAGLCAGILQPEDPIAWFCVALLGTITTVDCVTMVEEVNGAFTPEDCAFFCENGQPFRRRMVEKKCGKWRNETCDQQCGLSDCSSFVKSTMYSGVTSCDDVSAADYQEEAYVTSVCKDHSYFTCNSTHVISHVFSNSDCSGDAVFVSAHSNALDCDATAGFARQYECVGAEVDLAGDERDFSPST